MWCVMNERKVMTAQKSEMVNVSEEPSLTASYAADEDGKVGVEGCQEGSLSI